MVYKCNAIEHTRRIKMDRNIYIIIIYFIFGIINFKWQVLAAVNCAKKGVGRFPDPGDTTCKKYTYCVFVKNEFLAYNYQCPGRSLFSPRIRKCITNYVCNK